MKGTKYMKIFKIIDEENDLLSGVLLYYEKSRTAIIELPEYLDEWNAPLLFTGYIKKKIYTIPRDMSFCWIKERVIPSGRQNIGDILNTHHLKSYDEMQFLEISDGRCSQDSLYIRKTDEVPMFVEERQHRNLKECVIVGNGRLLCFFYDGCVKKVDIATLDNVDADDIAKVIRHKGLYESGQIGVGGYYITFNNSIDIPAWALYGAKETLPLTLEDFKKFTQKNMLDTTEVCNTLECSRQNISYIVKKKHILPIKESVRGNLYDKCEILRYKW